MDPQSNTASGPQWRFGPFQLDSARRLLTRDSERIPLSSKSIDLLIALVTRKGETLTKNELLETVWSGTTVEENSLNKSISEIRKAFGETRGQNDYIVTVTGVGYRFVAAVTDEAELPLEVPETRPKPQPYSRWMAAMAVGLLVLTAGGFGWWRMREKPIPGRPSIAVLRMRDLSKTAAETWLQTALAEMLTSELAAGGKLRTIPTDDIARWRSDLGPSAESLPQTEVLRSARENLNTDVAVLGSYLVTVACPQCLIRVDLGVVRARTGEQIGAVTEEGAASELLDLTKRLGQRLRSELGVKAEVSQAARWPASSAMREYAVGLQSLRQGDPVTARQHLEAAVGADPNNALVHSSLAEAWAALGYASRALEHDERAYELADTLDRLDRLGIEARYRLSIKAWNRSIEIYKSIFQLFPDSLTDGLNLARTQIHAGRAADASVTLSQLRRLPKPAGNDPRIDLTEAQAAGNANDFQQRTREFAHRAAEESRFRGARYLFGKARLLEGGAMQSLLDPQAGAVQSASKAGFLTLARRVR